MNAAKSEAEIRDEYRAKVALMPSVLVAQYVPLIKAYERKKMECNQLLFEMLAPYDAEIAEIEREFLELKPGRNSAVSLEDADHHRDAEFERRYPGLKAQWNFAIASFDVELSVLEASIDKDDFVSAGGTLEQLRDLEQAVLYGVFSRPHQEQELRPVSASVLQP